MSTRNPFRTSRLPVGSSQSIFDKRIQKWYKPMREVKGAISDSLSWWYHKKRTTIKKASKKIQFSVSQFYDTVYRNNSSRVTKRFAPHDRYILLGGIETVPKSGIQMCCQSQTWQARTIPIQYKSEPSLWHNSHESHGTLLLLTRFCTHRASVRLTSDWLVTDTKVFLIKRLKNWGKKCWLHLHFMLICW